MTETVFMFTLAKLYFYRKLKTKINIHTDIINSTLNGNRRPKLVLEIDVPEEFPGVIGNILINDNLLSAVPHLKYEEICIDKCNFLKEYKMRRIRAQTWNKIFNRTAFIFFTKGSVSQ